MILQLNQVSHDYGNRLLFSDINLTLDANTRAGLVGRNGTGKTTLFQILVRNLKPYRGSVHVARDYRIGYFAQEFSFASTEVLWDWLYLSKSELIDKKRELTAVENELTISQSEKLLTSYSRLSAGYESMGGYDYENQIKYLLINFGFKPTDYYRQIDDFSGGEKTRIRLISILLNNYDFLLFDEPTNHLDFLTVDWFIGYLKKVNKGYLIISHDRYLLDQVVNKIYEIKNQKIESYSGNFSSYLIQSADRELLLQKQYHQQQKLIERTEEFIRRNMGSQKTNLAKSRLKMLNRLDRIELAHSEKNIKLNITTSKRSGNDIYRMKNLKVGYENFTVIDDINLELYYRDRVCLCGANGSGKTTLLKTLLGEIPHLGGDLWTGYSLSVGYFDQNHIDLDPTLTILETIWDLAPGETFGYVMTFLARFGFSEDMIDQPVANISGGEKSRLYLAQLIHEKPNILILDEPTNHLDIAMIASLEEALQNYEGTIILVSHDRYFVNSLAKKYWMIASGTITEVDSIDKLMEKSEVEVSPIKESKKYEKQTKKKPNAYTLNKLLTEIAEIESNVKAIQDEIIRLQNLFSDSYFYLRGENITETNQQIAKLEGQIVELNANKDKLEIEYLELIE
jgi:ATP-binding cassette subfamily F protein 3